MGWRSYEEEERPLSVTGGDSNARVEYLQFRGRWLGLDWELMEGGLLNESGRRREIR